MTEPRIWLDAATQMFFTLTLGFGALVAFSSYNPVRNNCMRDAYIVVLINCGTSIFAGVVVFSILGYRELKTGMPAAEVIYIYKNVKIHNHISKTSLSNVTISLRSV